MVGHRLFHLVMDIDIFISDVQTPHYSCVHVDKVAPFHYLAVKNCINDMIT